MSEDAPMADENPPGAMPSLEQHCWESIALFGKPYHEVHLWLDELAGTPEFGFRHRRKRHHEESVREVMRRFGPDAAAAARQHIVSDLKQEGWTERDRFPRNEEDYVKMGLF